MSRCPVARGKKGIPVWWMVEFEGESPPPPPPPPQKKRKRKGAAGQRVVSFGVGGPGGWGKPFGQDGIQDLKGFAARD